MSDLIIGGQRILPGEHINVDLPVALLHTQTPLSMPVQIRRGRKEGPRLFISAAIHGDELNGVEIIRRLHQQKALSRLRGTLITIPIVNVYGVIHHSRYLPDRRDLNRVFPGSESGSLASRLAHLFMTEIVANCTHGIDIHTGALHRSNLPQIRVNLADADTERLARAFGVPVIMNSDLRDGSLREAASQQGIPMLLYEAGEALRFDEMAIRGGVKGVINVMRDLGMLPPHRTKHKVQAETHIVRSASWVRAPESGVFRAFTALGQQVRKGDVLGVVDSPYGNNEVSVIAQNAGMIIGKTNLPLINEGDALFHLARFNQINDAAEQMETFAETLSEISAEEPYLEPPII
jgi:predicted deacylase